MICVYYERTNMKCECGKPAKWKVYSANQYYNGQSNECEWLCPTCKRRNAMKKCKCGNVATCKVWEAVYGYAYYCDKCRNEQTMEGK